MGKISIYWLSLGCFSPQFPLVGSVLEAPRLGSCRSPSAFESVHFVLVLSEHCHLLSVLSRVANESPIQTSLGDQLGFFSSQKLIMSLSLVQFSQLMHFRIHKWPFVFV